MLVGRNNNDPLTAVAVAQLSFKEKAKGITIEFMCRQVFRPDA